MLSPMFNVSYWLVEAIRAPAGVFASRLSCVEIWELQDHKVVHRWFSLDYRIRICWIMLISLINFIGFVINCDHRCPFPIFSNCYSGCQRLAAHVEIPRKSGGSTRSSKLEHHGVVEIHDKKTHMKKTKQRDLKDVLWIFRVFFSFIEDLCSFTGMRISSPRKWDLDFQLRSWLLRQLDKKG